MPIKSSDLSLLSIPDITESADGFFGVRSAFRLSFHRLIRPSKKCRLSSDNCYIK